MNQATTADASSINRETSDASGASQGTAPFPHIVDDAPQAALAVATAFARQAIIALDSIGTMHPGRVRQDHERLCDARALLDAANRIVSRHADRLGAQL